MEARNEVIYEESQRVLGQFFTVTNPFDIDIFYKWVKLIPNREKEYFLEPYAGANNIVSMIQSLGLDNEWKCFDIAPSDYNAAPMFHIEKQDTIKNFPQGFKVAITNPPYLAKNSASRRGLEFPDSKYDDLYKEALNVMLQNTEYVAAIIPESFINANIFHDRLYAFVSLTCKMFDNTECPVCLSLFVPTHVKRMLNLDENDFAVYRQNVKVGQYNQLRMAVPDPKIDLKWKFNDKDGNIGIKCIDTSLKPSIEFIYGREIQPEKIKISSRSFTRLSGLPEDIDLDLFLKKCNKKLIQYREDTQDIFLTSFKGLRKDGRYRRRLDFNNAKTIMNSVIEEILEDR